jgi:hypothetical protein
MKAAIAVVVFAAACASSGTPTKVERMRSAAPIDADAAFATALATTQERFDVITIDAQHGRFATRPAPVTTSGEPLLVSYVVWFDTRRLQGCPAQAHCMTGRLAVGGSLSVAVTPVAFVGNAPLPADRVPREARDIADDLAKTIHQREQQQHVVY